jgi:hypothetical protein
VPNETNKRLSFLAFSIATVGSKSPNLVQHDNATPARRRAPRTTRVGR